MATIRVLLFAANPRGPETLDLPREFREIDEEVQRERTPLGEAVELILPSTRPVDLLRKPARGPAPGRPFQRSRYPGRDLYRLWSGGSQCIRHRGNQPAVGG